MKQSKLFKEILLLYALLALAVFTVYIHKSLAKPYFIGLLIWSVFSKRDYFFFALFFIIIQTPASLFMYTPQVGLPNILQIPGFTVIPPDVFTVIVFLKVILRKKPIGLKVKIPFVVLVIYFMFSFLAGITNSGSLKTPLWFLRSAFHLTWIISFVGLVETREKMFKFFYLLFPAIFFIIFSQVYFLKSGQVIFNVVSSENYISNMVNTLTGELRPITSAAGLIILCYIGAMLISPYKKNPAGKNYLNFIITLTVISVILSATRFLFGVFLFIFLGTYFNKIRNAGKVTIIIILISLVVIVFINTGVVTDTYIKESALGRVFQVFLLFSGKGRSIDTFDSRIYQLQPLFDRIGDNLLFGYGFSDISKDHYCTDWGAFNTILMFGIVGLALFVYLSISYLKLLFRALRRLPSHDPAKTSLRVLMISLFAFLGGYALTWDFFSFLFTAQVAFVMVFFATCENFAGS